MKYTVQQGREMTSKPADSYRGRKAWVGDKKINTPKECGGEVLDRGMWYQSRFLSFRIRNIPCVDRLGGKNALGKKDRLKTQEKKEDDVKKANKCNNNDFICDEMQIFSQTEKEV